MIQGDKLQTTGKKILHILIYLKYFLNNFVQSMCTGKHYKKLVNLIIYTIATHLPWHRYSKLERLL